MPLQFTARRVICKIEVIREMLGGAHKIPADTKFDCVKERHFLQSHHQRKAKKNHKRDPLPATRRKFVKNLVIVIYAQSEGGCLYIWGVGVYSGRKTLQFAIC